MMCDERRAVCARPCAAAATTSLLKSAESKEEACPRRR